MIGCLALDDIAAPPAGWGNTIPVGIGWYAIVLHWRDSEHVFTGSDFWNGQWSTDAVVLRSDLSFETETEALAWACDHDPGW